MARHLALQGGGAGVDAVEIDPSVVRASKIFFDGPPEAGEGGEVRVHVADAVEWCVSQSVHGAPPRFRCALVDLLTDEALAPACFDAALWAALSAMVCGDGASAAAVVAVNAGRERSDADAVAAAMRPHFPAVGVAVRPHAEGFVVAALCL